MADETEKLKKGGKLTSPSNIKKFCLEERKRLRPAWQADRVAASVYEQAEAHMRVWLRDRIQAHPTKGSTIT